MLVQAVEVVEAVRALALTPCDGPVPWKLGCTPAELPVRLAELAEALEAFDRAKSRARDPLGYMVRAVDFAEANGVARHGMVMAMRGDPAPEEVLEERAVEHLDDGLDPDPGDIGPPDPTVEFASLDSPRTRGSARKRTMVPGAAVGQSIRLAADAEALDMEAASDLEDVADLGDPIEAGDLRTASILERVPAAIADLVPKLKGDGMANARIDPTIQDAGDMSYQLNGQLDVLSDRLTYVMGRTGITPAIRRLMQALRIAKQLLVTGGSGSPDFALQVKHIDEALERIEKDVEPEPERAGLRF